jgi:acyl-CoA synthetase (AMP-forming)/AMP-acid ligase II
MPVAHLERLVDALPGVRVFVMYGATEAGARLAYLPPEHLARKAGSIGRAISNVELRILREDGTEAKVGETGEIVARGSNIMEGYWGDVEATREVLDEQGFHTGDLGWRDEEGFFWVSGRKREMIKSGAHRISPREIEEALLECQDVEEAAVVGRPDEYLGEAIVAHVTLRAGSSVEPAALREFCRERLPEYKVPGEIVVRDEMPRTPSGKIQKKSLRGEEGD